MSAEARRKALHEHLMKHGSVQVDDLAEMLGVSRMTVHRDLDRLAAQNVVRKVRGGATVLPSVLFESNYAWRSNQGVAEKRALARAGAGFVEQGHVVIIDDSSTAHHMTEWLVSLAPLTVVTNALGVMDSLAGKEGITLIALGGTFTTTFNAFVGLICEQALKSLRADLAFLSPSAVEDCSVYHQDEEVVRAKRAMMTAAERRILLSQASKFGKPALHWSADLSEFDEVLIAGDLKPSYRKRLRDAKIRHRIL